MNVRAEYDVNEFAIQKCRQYKLPRLRTAVGARVIGRHHGGAGLPRHPSTVPDEAIFSPCILVLARFWR